MAFLVKEDERPETLVGLMLRIIIICVIIIMK